MGCGLTTCPNCKRKVKACTLVTLPSGKRGCTKCRNEK